MCQHKWKIALDSLTYCFFSNHFVSLYEVKMEANELEMRDEWLQIAIISFVMKRPKAHEKP